MSQVQSFSSGVSPKADSSRRGLKPPVFRAVAKTMIGVLMIAVLSGGLTAQERKLRGESKVSMGLVVHDIIGIMKSFGYYIVPRYVAFDINFQYIVKELPIGVNVSLNLPVGKITPFVTAGAAASLRGTTILDWGGGLKYRVGKKTFLLAEYRHFRYNYRPDGSNVKEIRQTDYFGGGICYLF